MSSEDFTNRNYYYVPVSIKERLPELYKWVPVVDPEGEITFYRLTEHGWNMRDIPGPNSPRDGAIVAWLEKRTILS